MTEAIRNHLIELLPRRDKLQLLGLWKTVHLELAEVLNARGQPTRHVWFPLGASVSQSVQIDHHPGLEVAMVGHEGMLGATLALGVPEVPSDSVVQGPGTALRVASGPFRTELPRSSGLQRVIRRHLCVRMTQLSTSAACLHFHLILPRLACWLLMRQDREQDAHFRIAHEGLSCMLGMRRFGVTVAASDLQRQGLIRYHRGALTVLDRAGPEALSCPCYAADRKAHAGKLG